MAGLIGCSASSSDGGSAKTTASLSASCEDEEDRFNSFKSRQNAWYQENGRPVPTAKLQSVFVKGTLGHAIVIVHGFNSSPHNQRDLILALSAKGFTVFAPLLRGYGSDGEAGNLVDVDDWRESVNETVEIAKACNSKVSLLGHSFGGALVTDEVASGRLNGIDKVVSMAPFYRSASLLMDLGIGNLADALPVASISTLASELGVDPYGFLPLEEPASGEVEAQVPMLALQKVFDAQSLFKIPTTQVSSASLLLVVSHADEIIDNDFAIKYAKARYAGAKTLIYDESEDIGHSFQRRKNHPKFDAMIAQIVSHLQN